MDVPRRTDAEGPAPSNRTGDEAPDISVEPGIRVVANLPAEVTPFPALHNGRIAWHPDGESLFYLGAPPAANGYGPLSLLRLAEPATPRPVFPGPTGTVSWRPDGEAFAFTGAELVAGTGYVPFVARARVSRRPPGQLMEAGLIARGTPYIIHRWLDRRTLAGAYPVRSLWQIALLDTERRTPIPTPRLEASLFRWSEAGDRVAGQVLVWPDPVTFWIWDWRQGRFLRPPAPRGAVLPGAGQFFEAWSSDGRAALFTAWDGPTYDPDAIPTLYQLDVETGAVTRVAENAAMAAWSGDWIAYVTWEPTFALAMTRARDREVLWTQDLGLFPYVDPEALWEYRPRFAGPFVAFRNTPALWQISPADRKALHPFYRGDAQNLTWSPDGKHIAFLERNDTARLLVVENPLGRQPGSNAVGPAGNPHLTHNELAADLEVVADLPAETYALPPQMDSRMPWSPDGRRLLYVGPPPTGAAAGPLMLLDLNRPASPRPISRGIIANAAWHPSDQSFAFGTARLVPAEGTFLSTIYQMRAGAESPQELLTTGAGPGTEAVLQRWLDGRTLAFDQNVGTGLRRLKLLDTETRVVTDPSLGATEYRWAPAGDRLAGQLYIPPGPPYFWLWDRRSGAFLVDPTWTQSRLPGASQYFEAWSPDGRFVLFTAWDRLAYSLEATPTLYRLDVATREVRKVAANAAFAAWADDRIAYVKVRPRLTLTTVGARDHQVLWTDDLGSRIREEEDTPWAYRPAFTGPYLVYRTVRNEWRVARADSGQKRTFYTGVPGQLSAPPDGRYIALIHENQTARLLVLKNPLALS